MGGVDTQTEAGMVLSKSMHQTVPRQLHCTHRGLHNCPSCLPLIILRSKIPGFVGDFDTPCGRLVGNPNQVFHSLLERRNRIVMVVYTDLR